MTIRIVSVDAKDEKVIALLRFLQLTTLDSDEPYDVKDGHWWIAYDGKLPVAFAGVAKSSRWSDAGYLCRSGVLRSHRGRGLQKRLIRVRERKARDLGWVWSITDTTDNPASANSLIGCGYRIYKPAYAWGLKGAIYWRKKLVK